MNGERFMHRVLEESAIRQSFAAQIQKLHLHHTLHDPMENIKQGIRIYGISLSDKSRKGH
jgi:hypothetical protein